MKKKSILSILLVGALVIGLVGCGASSDKTGSANDKTIKIGVTPVPHKGIAEVAQKELEAKGYTVEIIEFSDYVTPNTSLEEGDLDANYFQTIEYLEQSNEGKGLHLTYTKGVHLEPLAAYSKTIKDLNELKDGATVAVPNDGSNEGRALRLLEESGLIKVKEGALVTVKDIIENKKNLKFEELEAAQLPRVLEEVDLAVINGNYALEAGLSPANDAVAIEDSTSEAIKNYYNVIAVREGTEDTQKIKDLTEALTSDAVKQYIEDTYKDGSVIPVF